MIIYRCDLCNELHEAPGEMDKWELKYNGQANVSFYKNGNFHTCCKCTTKILNQFRDAEKEIDRQT